MPSSREPIAGFCAAARSSSRSRLSICIHHRPRLQTQQLHTTPSKPAKHRSPYRSITQAELQRIADARARIYPKYTSQERQDLRAAYTPEQQAAIDLGEQAVSPHDLSQAKDRRDFLRPRHVDPHAFSRMQPLIDKRPSTARGEWDRTDDDAPTKNLDYLPDVDKKMDAMMDVMLDPGTEEDEPFIRAAKEDEPEEEGGNERGIQKQRAKRAELPERRRNILGDAWYELTAQNPIPTEDDYSTEAERQFIKAREEWQEGAEQREQEEEQALQEGRAVPDNTGPTMKVDGDNLLRRMEESTARQLKNRPRNHPLTAAQRLENALRWRDPEDAPETSQDIPKINDPRWEYAEAADRNEDETGESTKKDDDDESGAAWQRLAKSMGQPVEKLQKFRMKNLVTKRVVNQTRLGKIDSLYCLWVAGNEDGMLGLGEGKADESEAANRMAQLNAVRAMKPILRYEKRTIFGEVLGKVGAVELKINARPPGYGLRVSSYAYEIAKCAGLKDLQAKSLRSRNPMNVCKAMVEALQKQKDPEDVARSRGKKLVDVRKVYYAGLV